LLLFNDWLIFVVLIFSINAQTEVWTFCEVRFLGFYSISVKYVFKTTCYAFLYDSEQAGWHADSLGSLEGPCRGRRALAGEQLVILSFSPWKQSFRGDIKKLLFAEQTFSKLFVLLRWNVLHEVYLCKIAPYLLCHNAHKWKISIYR